MSIWALTYQQSVFKHYHSDKHFSEFLPTRWHQKSTGVDIWQNYITVTLCITSHVSGPGTAVGRLCACLCYLWMRWPYLYAWFTLTLSLVLTFKGLSYRSQFMVTGGKLLLSGCCDLEWGRASWYCRISTSPSHSRTESKRTVSLNVVFYAKRLGEIPTNRSQQGHQVPLVMRNSRFSTNSWLQNKDVLLSWNVNRKL